jgi:predicted DNA-binding transcriptional regulator AlpA
MKPEILQNDRLLEIKTVANWLTISESTLYRWRKDQPPDCKLKFVKVGRKAGYRILKSSVIEFLADQLIDSEK